MIRFQRSPLEVVDIVPRHLRSKKHKVFSGTAEANQFLREIIFESGSSYAVRDMMARALRFTDINLLSETKLIERLAFEVTYGELKVVVTLRDAPMPPQTKKIPDVPAIPKPQIPKIPHLPPLQLPKLPNLNIKLQLDVLDLAAMLGIPLAEICPKGDPSDSSDDGSPSDTSSDVSAPEDTSSDASPDQSSDASPDQSSDQSASPDQSSDHSASPEASASPDKSPDQSPSDAPEPYIVKLNLTDPHFNLDSAFLVPDFQANLEAAQAGDVPVSAGLNDVAYALALASKFPDHCLLVAGHTDTTGSVDYNQPLSEARAKAVLSILKNDKQGFVDAANGHYSAIDDDDTRKERITIDLQTVLAWAAGLKSWDCDPQGIDGIPGAHTFKAMGVFSDKTGSNVSIDDPTSWLGPTFDLYNDFLTNLPAIQSAGGLDQCRAVINTPAPKAAGYSKLHPINPGDDLRDEVNRRCELLWFPAGADKSYGYLDSDQPDIYEDGSNTIKAGLISDNKWDTEVHVYNTGDALPVEKDESDAPPEEDPLECVPDDSYVAPNVYVVKTGDSLSAIAEEFYGDYKLWPLIYDANKYTIGDNPNLIYPGQTLRIPSLDSVTDDQKSDAQSRSKTWKDSPTATDDTPPETDNSNDEAPETESEEEGTEIVILSAGFGWEIKDFGTHKGVDFSLGLSVEGEVIWTGKKKDAPKRDSKEAKQHVEKALLEKVEKGFKVPFLHASFQTKWLGSFTAFTAEWEKKEKENEKTFSIGELEVCTVDFKWPGSKEADVELTLKLKAGEINIAEWKKSKVGVLEGSAEVPIIEGEWEAPNYVKIKGGVKGELGASAALSDIDWIKKKLGLGEEAGEAGEAAEAAEGAEATEAAEAAETAEAVEGATTAGDAVAGEVATDVAVAGAADVALTVGIVVVGVGAIAYGCYKLFQSWAMEDTKEKLADADTGAVAGFMDALCHHTTNTVGDPTAYMQGWEAGLKQRAKLIKGECKGNAASLDKWLAKHKSAVRAQAEKDFHDHARKGAFEQHAKPRQGHLLDNSLSTLKGWWEATLGGDPKSTGMMSEWEKYRGPQPTDHWYDHSDPVIWSGDWSSLS